jgi:hypothetical protein
MDSTTQMNQGIDFPDNLPLNKWTSVQIRVIGDKKNSWMTVKVGNITRTTLIRGRRNPMNCNLYVADDIYTPANTQIFGFMLK